LFNLFDTSQTSQHKSTQVTKRVIFNRENLPRSVLSSHSFSIILFTASRICSVNVAFVPLRVAPVTFRSAYYIIIRNGITDDLYTGAEVVFGQTRRIDLSAGNDANKLR